jgi:ABC-type transport system involved in multi-copper enzyme maturation permease subunit
MTAGTIAPHRPGGPAGRGGFGYLLRAEWTKFRTVPGWVIAVAVAVLLTVLVGLWAAAASHNTCGSRVCEAGIPLGPGGEAVTDSFYFVHQPLDGNGTITVQVTSLTGVTKAGKIPAGSPSSGERTASQPWAKAGLIIKEGTTPGSAYAAIMVTPGRGVRMQYNYTGDTAGPPGAVSATSPRWLRLTRSGDTITGHASADGTHWTTVGTTSLPGLSSTVQAGLFVASPASSYAVSQNLGGGTSAIEPTLATAVFGPVTLQGSWPRGRWSGNQIDSSGAYPTLGSGSFSRVGGSFTVTGSGDIAPALAGTGITASASIEHYLAGAFAGLIVMIVVGTMFITAEYRRGLIRTTLTASPRRGRVLAAKAIVIGSITFVAALAAAIIVVPLGEHVARGNGYFVFPVAPLTELRVIVGSAALVALAAVLALAVGTVLRHSAGAVTAAIVVIVLPYILSTASILPAGPSQWLLRLTPAAAFAIEQSAPQYPQVSAVYTPSHGYFPLAPWAGLAVLCGYAALTLGIAVFLLRRRDA